MVDEKRLDLIDRSSLGIGKAKREVFDNPAYADGWNSAIAIIENAPTVDAVEVVHGRWVLQKYYGGMRKGMVSRIICSECGYPSEKTNYCPCCGAKMDGGNEDG